MQHIPEFIRSLDLESPTLSKELGLYVISGAIQAYDLSDGVKIRLGYPADWWERGHRCWIRRGPFKMYEVVYD